MPDKPEFALDTEHLQTYLREQFGADAELTGVGKIGSIDLQGMKGLGYGKPLLISYEQGGQERSAVLSVMRGDSYGHQFYWDRAAVLMFQHATSDRMEKHCRALALGYIDEHDRLHAVCEPREFFIINEKLEGHDYYLDLDRIRKGDFREADRELAAEFARWLARVHSRRLDDPALYMRRVRQTVGDSECIMGLIDEAYPHPYTSFPDERFIELEKKIVDWRWRMRDYTHRLAAVHGDFHPWNVLVGDDMSFSVIDRSRGEWGEPGDDISCMAANYLLFGIYEKPELGGDFMTLYRTFMDTYLEATGDEEVLRCMSAYFVFRGLVIASPNWYPDHPDSVRQGLFRFMENVLADEVFDYADINRYMA
jgi:hypothetical protein